ncbi:MAG: hypothetical protein ACRDFC_06210 [Ignavibacteria bacterium]
MKLLKFIIIIFFFLSSDVEIFAQLGGHPGSFARLGFGARGISMGNAMTSVTNGDIVGYYNPALSSFQNEHLIFLSYSFLSFDRTLNFVSYTKNFKLPKQEQGGAGITFSWINAGVSKIDGRDYDGFHTEDYSVSENQFLFAPSIRVSEKVAFGIGFKFYYSKLFDGVTSTSLGFDFGVLYKVNDKINVGISAKDIKSKYEWNTNDIYGQFGNTTKNEFPILYTLGLSYLLPKNFGIVSLDYELSNRKSNIIKMGLEVSPLRNINFRAGFDRFDFNNSDKFGNSKVMFGVGYQKSLKKFIVGLDYSFVMEPYSNKPFQTITAVFKIK